jgi:hypothetical protein
MDLSLEFWVTYKPLTKVQLRVFVYKAFVMILYYTRIVFFTLSGK